MNIKKALKTIMVILVMGILAVPLLSCGSEPAEAESPENQVVTVQRGDLTIDITAAGNLELSHTEDLAIDLFYSQSGFAGTKGTIGEVLVEEGDTVEEGQVLVTVDKDEWDDQLSILEKALVTAQRTLTTKETNVTKAERQITALERQIITEERDLAEAERLVATKEFAVRQAEVNLQTAEYNLSQIDEVKEAQDAVEDAELNLRAIKLVRTGEFSGGLQGDFTFWSQQEALAEAELAEAEQELEEVLAGTSATLLSSTDAEGIILEINKKQLLVEQEQMDLEDAQTDVEDARSAVIDAQLAVDEAKYDLEYAQLSLEDAKYALEDAESDLEDAQSDVDEANSLSPEIKAPFAGFITRVNVQGGDEVVKGTIAVQIADPNKFEADILVSEIDISQVKLGGEAWVEVDALQGMTLPATVTQIAPTATIQQGVVNYEVKVEIESLEAVIREGQEARQQMMADIAAGELPAPLQQAIEEGRITREQVEEMIKQGPPAGMEIPPGVSPPEMEGSTQSQVTMSIPEDFQLREGLTVTVTIIVAERTDVLLVPNAAITTEGRQPYVQVVLPDGTTEERAVQTGISDWQFTEITDGLSEGEQVLVPQGTTTTTTTEEEQPRGPMFFGGPPPR